MSHFLISVNTRHFTREEQDVIDDLSKKRKLGDLTARALKTEIGKLRPDLPAASEREFIGTNYDIETQIEKFKVHNPKATSNFIIDIVRTRLGRALAIRPFYLDELDKVLLEDAKE